MADHPMSLTFTIPFYRQFAYLQRAVESVRGQSSSDWELIISADGGLVPEAEEYIGSLDDPRIRYSATATPLGMVGNWNRCLNLAAGEFVTLLHDDDELEPDYAERMLHVAHEFPEASAYFCRTKIIDKQGDERFSFPDYYKSFLRPAAKQPVSLSGESAAAALMRGNFIFCPTLMFRRDRLGEQRFDDRWRMVQDLDFIVRLLLKDQHLVQVPDILYRYRRHRENATETYSADLSRFDEEWALLQELSATFNSRGWHQAAEIAARGRIIRLNLLYNALRSGLKGRGAVAMRQLRHLGRLRRVNPLD
ncbi:glycosyltransferase [Rubinisphaera sp. JC750]|uniref:glycosyltransferase n=1 Tax=Rubinisphaera sp. JC750 TaxID=2898658 RepID=UPI001F470560|nr:glycosyltransferase [Rubinisphaera sp. JC750]